MQRDLVERAMAGDHGAFSELARGSIARLYAAARLILRDDHRAEDATQEALFAAWRDLSALRDPDRFDAWLHRLLVRACYRDARRGRRRWAVEMEIVEVAGIEPDLALDFADRDQIERGFRRLDPDQRTVIVLHYYLRIDGARSLWAVGADGSQSIQLAGPFATIPGWIEWSPQADVIALTLDEDPSTIRMVRTDGSGMTTIQTGLAVAWNPIFRPPDGRQLTFAGEDASGTRGIYLVDRDGANLRRLELDPGFETDQYYAENRPYYFDAPSWSVDGSKLTYHTLEPAGDSQAGPGFRIHLAEVDPVAAVTAERILEFDPATDDEFDATQLPTGDAMLYQTMEGTVHRLWFVGTSPGAVPHDLGIQTSAWIGHQLSPEGREVHAFLDDGSGTVVVQHLNLASGPITTLAAGDDLSWQRTAR